MTNIPTELLRTLIAVVDLRSFTKAARSLGITQPAVSAQIKRLQGLLGSELLDKSAPGVTLTSAGEVVVNYARRLLSINDQILDLSGPSVTAQPVRLGMTCDFATVPVARALAGFRKSHPQTCFSFGTGNSDSLFRALREGEMDVVVAFAGNGTANGARHHWTDELVWVRGAAFEAERAGALPLVSFGDDCVFYHAAMAALNRADIQSDLVFSGSSISALRAAVVAGLGVMVLPRSRVEFSDLIVCDDTRLPKLPGMLCGIYLREGSGHEIRERVADALAGALYPPSASSPRMSASA